MRTLIYNKYNYLKTIAINISKTQVCLHLNNFSLSVVCKVFKQQKIFYRFDLYIVACCSHNDKQVRIQLTRKTSALMQFLCILRYFTVSLSFQTVENFSKHLLPKLIIQLRAEGKNKLTLLVRAVFRNPRNL